MTNELQDQLTGKKKTVVNRDVVTVVAALVATATDKHGKDFFIVNGEPHKDRIESVVKTARAIVEACGEEK